MGDRSSRRGRPGRELHDHHVRLDRQPCGRACARQDARDPRRPRPDEAWLDPAISPAEALSLCEPLAADRMSSEIRPLGRRERRQRTSRAAGDLAATPRRLKPALAHDRPGVLVLPQSLVGGVPEGSVPCPLAELDLGD